MGLENTEQIQLSPLIIYGVEPQMLLTETFAFSYATEKYLAMGKVLGIKCLESNFGQFILYKPQDLDSSFCIKNSDTLSYTRGAGYWIWKPYLLLKVANQTKPGTIVFYSDTGVLPRKDAEYFTNLIKDDKIHVWANDGATIIQWVDFNVLSALKFPTELNHNPMIMGGFLLAKNSTNLRNFAKIWLELCEQPHLLRPDTLNGYEKPPETIWHRYDQSILSVIVATNPSWFSIHSLKPSEDRVSDVFDIHRNEKIKAKIFITSFPQLRIMRQEIVKKMPSSISRKLRSLLFDSKRRNFSPEENESLKKSF